LRVEHDVDVRRVALEVGRQHLDGSIWIPVTDGADRRGPDTGPAVIQLVARDTRDDAVPQVHLRHGVGDPPGLTEIELGWAPVAIAQKLQDRVQMLPRIITVAVRARPAFAEVGALGALAHGVKLVLIDEPPRGGIAGPLGSRARARTVCAWYPSNLKHVLGGGERADVRARELNAH
jgi:hypothetical protein